MITRLLEILAPHTDPNDLGPGEVDGGFWDRVHQAESDEGRTSLWEGHWPKRTWTHPSLDVFFGWGITKMGLGVDFETEQAGPGYHGGPGSVNILLQLGPLYLAARYEWVSPAARQKELDTWLGSREH